MIEIAILFVVLGILVKYGRLHFLIAGYNTMSKEAKAQYDIEGIAGVFRNAMFVMAFINCAGYFAAGWLENPEIKDISLFAALLVGIPYLLIKSNSCKYKIRNR